MEKSLKYGLTELMEVMVIMGVLMRSVELIKKHIMIGPRQLNLCEVCSRKPLFLVMLVLISVG